jgi:hypothetical protein
VNILDAEELLDALAELVQVAERAAENRDQWHSAANQAAEERDAAVEVVERAQAALERLASGETFQSSPGVLDRSYSGREAQAMKQFARAALNKDEPREEVNEPGVEESASDTSLRDTDARRTGLGVRSLDVPGSLTSPGAAAGETPA